MSSPQNVTSPGRLKLAGLAIGSAAILICLARPAWAVTDEEIDGIIEKAKAALLARQQTCWTIRVYKRERKQVLKKVAEDGRMVEKMQLEEWTEVPADVFFGEPIQDLPNGGVAFKTKEGQVIEAAKERIAYCEPPGHFHPERESTKSGGASCVALLALLEAGVSYNNKQIQAGLKYIEGYDLKMTYSRALRANIYAFLVDRVKDTRQRTHYRRLLTEDMRWLEGAMSEDGWYHYGSKTKKGSGDNSCTQFGVLGMWACANANMEIRDVYWDIVEQHWLEHQGRTGGWSYVGIPPDVVPKLEPGDAPLKNLARATMTTAGVNTLYVVLDKLHTRNEQPYRWLKGVRPDPRTRQAVAAIFHAIDGGLQWMAKNGAATSKSGWGGYQEFGLERLGVASGLKYIGDVDWFASNANVIAKHNWTGEPVTDGFLLLFLVYGRAPIIFNKLQWGEQDQWNYYFRDLHYLCRYMNQEFERIHKWQIVSLDSSLHDLQDAPILCIAGSGPFEPKKEQTKKLRDYCDAGGTIVAHANRADSRFAASFKKLFVDLYKDRGYTFESAGKDHPVFETHFGRDTKRGFKKKIELEGMSDGGRTFVFVFDGDIAGALHQDRFVTYPDAFRIMTNIRFYAGPAYDQLPGRLRPKDLPGKPAKLLGTLKIGRVRHDADWDANPTAWMRMGKLLRHFQGVAVEEVKGVKLDDPGALKEFDLLHVTGHGKLKLDGPQTKALEEYMAGGGLVLIDTDAGDQDFAKSAGAVVDQMYPDKAELIDVAHPIIQGGPGGTKPLEKLRPTRWGSSRLRGRDAPPISAVKIGDRVALLFAPFDLTASMDGHFIYGMHGYQRDSALRIMTNILMWRFDQRKGG
ncbi:MAG: DUF4159 domain-containing protein [Phycisphaerae bacterium]|nr:DUF4159 domain-containing protein [Phycisphaerae bacterium]